MKISVCGLSKDTDENIAEKSFEIGKLIAQKGHTVLTGGCNGYPYEAAKGAFSSGGKVIYYSPAKNIDEHRDSYNFPTDFVSEFNFTGLGMPGRNFPLVNDADAIIVIGGKIGTLTEFALAFHQAKFIGVLLDSGGITPFLNELAEVCDKKGEKDKVVYEKEPEVLLKKVISISNILPQESSSGTFLVGI